MSAIFGVLMRENAAAQSALLASMDAALTREGPDGSGMWIDGPVGLGHRLACFTAEDRLERQPIRTGDGELALAMDGRVDNRPELARSLGIGYEEARVLADSGFVLRAYARWEDRFVDHVVGEFAFAMWDGRKRRLLLGCSAPLPRPLYYHSSPQMLAFASRPRGLLALPHVERRINEEKVAGWLAMVDTDRTASFYRDLHRLLPGQIVIADADGTRVGDPWQPDLRKRIRFRRDADYVAAFDELFDRVVADHLRGDGPTGIFMSGGLDSGSIAASAARRLDGVGRRLAAYTEVPPIGFDGPVLPGAYADETPLVRALAGMHQNIDLQLVRPERRGLLADVESFFTYAEVPFRNASNRGWMEEIYGRAQSAGVRVLLTGDQGNLTVSWDGRALLPELLREGRVVRALREAHATARTGRARSTWRAFLGAGVRPLLPTAVSRAVEWLRSVPHASTESPGEFDPLIDPEFAAAHGLAERIESRRARDLNPTRDSRDVRLRVLLGTGSLGAEACTGYRSMFGIDTRRPLADRRLVEFCLALPEEQYARGGETRLLIRRGMAGRLPREVLSNKQRGVQGVDWFVRMNSERTELLAEVSAFEHDQLVSRVLDIKRLRRLLEQWPSDVAADPRTVSLYRHWIGMALMTGRFLLWLQAGPAA